MKLQIISKSEKTGESIKSKLYPKVLFSVLLLAILLLSFYIIKPFLPALITGALIAYLSYPLYEKTLKYINKRNFASFIVAVFIVLLFTIPSIIVLTMVAKEAYVTYTSINQHNLGSNFLRIACKDEGWLSCRAVRSLIGFLPEKDLDYYLQVTIEKITGFIISNFSEFIASIPSILLNFFVMVFVVYYSLKDGEIIAKKIKNILPLKDTHKQHVMDKFHSITYATFYGTIFVAIIQGFLGGLGFFILGVPSPILWGAVMVLFALLPYVGTAVVWLPAALNLIFIGYLQNDSSSTIRGVILIAYGLLVISSIDNFLMPKLISAKANVHPVLVLLGILGGLSLFGFIGVILGPVVLALLMTFVEIYENEKAELERYF